MRICTHGSSSFMAIVGGVLFLVLPVAFLNGTVSITYVFFAGPACYSGVPSPTNPHCPVAIVPMPEEMALYLIFLGIVGILLGFLTLRLDLRARTRVTLGFSLGLAFSLGLMAFLLGMAISRILESFFITPYSFLVFPDLSIIVMAGATVVFVYEFLRARLSLPLTIAEANTHQ